MRNWAFKGLFFDLQTHARGFNYHRGNALRPKD